MSDVQAKWVALAPGARRRVITNGEKLMLVQVELDKGSIVPEHKHPHEQASYVISGQIQYTISGKISILNAGQSILIPSNELHSVTTIEASTVLDFFSPPREDFRAK